jgi:hypothetical protein
MCVSFLAFKLAVFSSSVCVRLGGGAGGESAGELTVPAAGLYMLVELLILLRTALNLSFPVSESISSREESPPEDGGLLTGGGVAI